jgi:hypothetical protein
VQRNRIPVKVAVGANLLSSKTFILASPTMQIAHDPNFCCFFSRDFFFINGSILNILNSFIIPNFFVCAFYVIFLQAFNVERSPYHIAFSSNITLILLFSPSKYHRAN